jgi:hypothetical protein
MIKLLSLALCALLLNACSVNVKPWERGNLAKPAMTFGGDGLVEDTDDHIYFSKEASSGGRSIAAGGCGCN